MPPSSGLFAHTLTPFLYPCLDTAWTCNTLRAGQCPSRIGRILLPRARRTPFRSVTASASSEAAPAAPPPPHVAEYDPPDHLNPSPSDYSSTPFTDACTLTVSAGGGGHGCISFLREKYIANGPPNGGDGGTGGSVYIQAVDGETSLHKLARRSILKAGRGKNGQGSLKGGARGQDVLITVPVGTVVREVSRRDPLDVEHLSRRPLIRHEPDDADDSSSNHDSAFRRDKWLIYPGTLPKSFSTAELPPLPPPRRSHLASLQPAAPLRLDLDKAMDTPMLLAAGAMGGMGNPHFITRSLPRPKFATKGDEGMSLALQLELKLLADVGLVGLPNAGKSTLLRALTRSRTRVGNWAFTTLSPNIGTVVLDTHVGRPALDVKGVGKEPRTNFTIADIPGLIEGAHLDRGLGLGFLRHIERAAILAFVIDLSARDAVAALRNLWTEISEYEKLRECELYAESQHLRERDDGLVAFEPLGEFSSPDFEAEAESARTSRVGTTILTAPDGSELPPLSLPPINSKPWFVVGTKADLKETQDNFVRLRTYLDRIEAGAEPHPSGKANGWRKKLYSVPVSAMKKEGTSGLPGIILGLLDK